MERRTEAAFLKILQDIAESLRVIAGRKSEATDSEPPTEDDEPEAAASPDKPPAQTPSPEQIRAMHQFSPGMEPRGLRPGS